MKKIHITFLKVLSVVVIVGICITQFESFTDFFRPKTAYAVGDLSVDWGGGIDIDIPLFDVSNMIPGDIESRIVIVKNNAPSSRPVGVRSKNINNIDTLSDVLTVVIEKNGTAIYGTGSSTGTKTLTNFFTESSTIDGLLLSHQSPSSTTLYEFFVSFDALAGNEYQNKKLTFDLEIGISIPVPLACQHIDFGLATPLFGTKKSDSITGTAGNDLIYVFEGGDKVDGKGGNDCIVGGIGGDELIGGNGHDVILGEEGGDSLVGGAGNDMVLGGNGSDTMRGDAGNDTIIGENGSDDARGGVGTDSCDAEAETQCEL